MESGAVVTPPLLARPLKLVAFRGLMLDPRRVGDPGSARLFARPYRAASNRVRQWHERGQLTRDDTPAVYLHEYTESGITIRGLVGALDLTRRATTPEERAVLPHEGIHPTQADELADRMSELRLNPAPILLVHHAPDDARALVQKLAATPPEREFTDRGGQRHRIWAFRSAEDLERLDEALAASQALIADGHHRYAAYLRMQRRAPGGPADQGLAMLIDQEDTPMFLGPIHRVLEGVNITDLAAAADSIGATPRRMNRDEAVAALAPTVLVATDGRSWTTIDLPDRVQPVSAVEQLHDRIVPALPRGPRSIGYHHSVDSALGHLRRGAVAILMPAPEVELVHELAAAGRLLPEKATSFQPKPSPGVLIRSLHDE